MTLTVLSWRVDQGYLLDAILGARLSYGSGEASDSVLHPSGVLELGPSDRAFIEARLNAEAGAPGEGKFARAVPVSAFIRAPLRWWVNYDTHRFPEPEGETVVSLAETAVKQSTSLMHHFRKRGELRPEQCTPTTDPRSIEIANEHFRAWRDSGEGTNGTSESWLRFQDSIPRGVLYTAHWYANYSVLRAIRQQRERHRQREFAALCAWMDTLPHGWITSYRRRERP